MAAGVLALSLVGGFLAVFAAAPAGAATESFSLSSAPLAGQSTISWQGSPNTWTDPTTLSGQIDPSSGAISGASLSIPPLTEAPTEGETPTFTFTEVNPGSATGTFDSATGAVTLNDSLTLTFNVQPINYTCVSTPINVALSGTYDSTSEDVTLATTSSFTIPQFPSASPCSTLVAPSLNAYPGGVAGSVGNAMSFALHGQFAPGLPTTTALAVSPASPGPVLAGTAVTLTATVTDPSAAGTPTGTVNFLDNGGSVGTGALTATSPAGTATTTLTTTALPGGNDQQLTATYGGDTTYGGSTSAAVPYTVTPLPAANTSLPSSITVPTSSPAPTVSSLSTNAGPPGGGTSVTVNGSGFTSGATVSFGSTQATNVTVNGTGSITATSPSGTGTVNVTVTTSNGTSAASTADLFSYGTPTVSGVSPNSGSNEVFLITGTNFVPGASVSFGSTVIAASNVTVNSSTSIAVKESSSTLTGTQDVTVTTPNGTSATSPADQVTVGGLLVTRVNPTGGVATGGSSVTLTGQAFTGATVVDFGTTPATSFTVASATSITATVPAGTAGTVVNVTVTTSSGTSSAWWADQFAYGVPTVAAVSPNGGPAAGGSTVTITGTGFIEGYCTSASECPAGGSAVKFGTTAATNVTVVSPTEITATAPAGTGTENVTVTNGAGTSATTAADEFTYAPTVTAVSLPSGATAGGTSVTITGTGFTGATAVDFGTAAATGVTVVSTTEITATSPAGTAGATNVTVTTPGGTSPTSVADQFFYGAPTVTAVSPSAGPLAGDTTITITGTGLGAATAVKFGSNAATSYTVNSATSITAVSPLATTAGVVHVVVTTNGGSSSSTAAGGDFTYSQAPSVTSVSPTAPTGGSTTVTITGANFTGASSVNFGTTPATSFTVASASQITAIAPSGTGTVDVTVVSPTGTSATWSGDQFAYGAPAVTSVSPNAGPAAGGTGVVIRGSGFATGATVNFGTTPATSVTVVSSTEITALAPAGSAGTVDVTVTTLAGTSATSSSDQFTYGTGSTPAQFALTVTNPAAGQSWPDLYAKIVLAGVTSEPASNVTLSYQDSSGAWCPLSGSGTTTLTFYLSGAASSCGSPPSSMSLSAGGSITIPMQLAYNSGTYLGAQSVTTTLYSGTCSSPTSCTQSGTLDGTVVATGSVNVVPVGLLDATIAPTKGVAATVRQGFSLTLAATVAATDKTTGLPTYPTGTVSFLIDGNSVGSVALDLGAASYGVYDTSDLAPGTHTFTFEYSGDAVFAPATVSQSVTVLPPPAGTPYTCTVANAALGGGQAYVTATASTPSPTVSGTSVWLTNMSVTLDIDARGNSTNSNGFNSPPQQPVTFALSPGGAATSSVVPTFSLNGAGTDWIGTWSNMSALVPVTGTPGTSMPVSLGDSFSYTYGTVAIGVGTVPPVLTCTADAGGAPVATVPVAGNTLAVSPSGSAAPGTPVTLTDTVSPAPPSTTAAGQYGQVDFYDGSTDLGTVPVGIASGTATLTTSALAVGAHQLTAVWSGSGNLPANASSEVDYMIGSTSTTTLASSANPANAANPVTFTATVTPQSGATVQPTGDVAFSEDGNPIASCASQPLSTDSPPTATCTISIGAGETHSIVATYSGDGNFTGSASQPLTQTTLPGTTTTVFSTKNPSPPGKVTIWAGVSPSGTGANPTGNVGFTIDGKGYSPCGAVPLGSGGGASCTVSFKAGTSHKVFATYAGSSTYSGSTSNTITQTVTGSSGSTKPKTTTATATLASGKTLSAGQSLTAGNYRLTMQSDGNLVEYQGSKARWASGTSGRAGATVTMQTDGNLVEYQKGKAIWSTKTAGHTGAHLTLQGSDGNVVIYGPGGKAIWATGT